MRWSVSGWIFIVRRSIHRWAILIDMDEEDTNIEKEVVNSMDKDKQKHPPNDDGQEKDHRFFFFAPHLLGSWDIVQFAYLASW